MVVGHDISFERLGSEYIFLPIFSDYTIRDSVKNFSCLFSFSPTMYIHFSCPGGFREEGRKNPFSPMGPFVPLPAAVEAAAAARAACC